MKKEEILGTWKVYMSEHDGDKSLYMGAYTLNILPDGKYSESSTGFPLSVGNWEFDSKKNTLTLVPDDSIIEKLNHPLLSKAKFVLGYTKIWEISISDNLMSASRLNTSDCDEYNNVHKMVMQRM